MIDKQIKKVATIKQFKLHCQKNYICCVLNIKHWKHKKYGEFDLTFAKLLPNLELCLYILLEPHFLRWHRTVCVWPLVLILFTGSIQGWQVFLKLPAGKTAPCKWRKKGKARTAGFQLTAAIWTCIFSSINFQQNFINLILNIGI